KVAVNYFGSPAKADAVVASILCAGGVAAAFQADVRDEGQVTRMIEQVQSTLGPIDILVPNATGPQPFRELEELTWRDCLDQLEFFVKSPLLLTKAVLPGMRQRRFG